MSTDSLFRSIPTKSLNDAQTDNKSTTEVSTKTPPLSTTTPLLTPTTTEVDPNSLFPNANLPPKRDISSIPPIFFVGAKEKEEIVIVEPEGSTTATELEFVGGHGDRRLSGILAETNDIHEEEKKDHAAAPAKRIALSVADANRGIFGNKHLKVNADRNPQSKAPETTPVSTLTPSRSIRVFGYPPNLVHNVIQHFMTYGKIENYQISPGNWITITFENSSMALAALKSNGVVISKMYLIGVSLEKEETKPAVAKNIIPMDVSNGVFKNLNNANNGVGSGKAGVSAENKYRAATGGIIATIKDALFGW